MKARAQIVIPGRISDAEALWYDTSRWPTFVDGFGHVVEIAEQWPDPGSKLIWQSGPN